MEKYGYDFSGEEVEKLASETQGMGLPDSSPQEELLTPEETNDSVPADN